MINFIDGRFMTTMTKIEIAVWLWVTCDRVTREPYSRVTHPAHNLINANRQTSKSESPDRGIPVRALSLYETQGIRNRV